MKSKILCLFVIVSVLCSLFVISVSAQEDYVIEAGTYTFNAVISYLSLDYVNLPFTVTSYNPETQLDEVMTFDTLNFSDVSTTGTPYYRLDYLYYGGSTLQNILQVYSDVHHWNEIYDFYKSIFEEAGEPLPSWLDATKGVGQTITVTEDTSVSATFYNWFMANTLVVPPTSTALLRSGNYEPTGDSFVPSFYDWIESGQTLWFDLRGYVITGFSTGTWFDKIGIEFLSFSDTSYRIYLYVEYQGTNLGPVFTSLYNNGVTTIEWVGDFTEAYGFYISSDTVVTEDFNNFWLLTFDSVEYVYTGNVWYDIIDSVVDTLKTDIFGTFSPWDVVVTFVGLSVFLWLLKVLAGG